MKRYLIAFASALVGVALTVPYAALNFRDLPPIAPKVANGPPPQMTLQEMLFVSECCIVFYAVTYFVGKRIYAVFGTQEDLRDIQQFLGGHMRLLHSFAGAFMVASFWVPIGNQNPWAKCLSLTVGLMLLTSGVWGIVGWARTKLARRSKQPAKSHTTLGEIHEFSDEPANQFQCDDEIEDSL